MKIQPHTKISVLAVAILLAFAAVPALADAPPSTPTAISISLSTKSVILGNSLTVNGSVTPSESGFPAVSGVAVNLTYTKPDATTTSTTVTTGADGSFSDVYNPDISGSWSVSASWAGNVDYLGATSFGEAFTVTDASAAGFPMVYVYAAVVAIIVVIAAIAAYLYVKKR